MSRRQLVTNRFHAQVDRWVLNATSKGAASFDDLLHGLPGVYPTFVKESLKRLGSRGEISKVFVKRILHRIGHSETEAKHIVTQSVMPVPHPLDFEWRFSQESIDRLLQKCYELTGNGEIVAFLGTPTLAKQSAKWGESREVVLIDSNRTMVDHVNSNVSSIKVFPCNVLTDRVPMITAAAVIVDPPWYEEFMQSFLWMAAQICMVGGNVLLSMPPVGTRPGMEDEWFRILDWAKTLHFGVTEIERKALPYISPPFEQNALKAEGICQYPDKWRCGDLVILTLKQLPTVSRPSAPNIETDWDEAILRGVRIRVKVGQNHEFRDPTLISIVEGDILPSVSRRDRRRQLPDVWTSGNRIFRCEGPEILLAILNALADENSPYEAVSLVLGRKLETKESMIVSTVAQQVTRLVKTELEENVRYAGKSKETSLESDHKQSNSKSSER